MKKITLVFLSVLVCRKERVKSLLITDSLIGTFCIGEEVGTIKIVTETLLL